MQENGFRKHFSLAFFFAFFSVSVFPLFPRTKQKIKSTRRREEKPRKEPGIANL